jgi:hypothetical protein
MLALNRSLLNTEYSLMNVLKNLASIVTPRYFTLFTNGMFCPFNVRRESERKVDRLSLILIDLNISAFTPGRHGI